ncbi:MAG TPA: hypothetical protein VGX03_39805, partial [Candidatus Binatia bacterium]|nr:hypothetical protein [Candidatus Binatia bacterium]
LTETLGLVSIRALWIALHSPPCTAECGPACSVVWGLGRATSLATRLGAEPEVLPFISVRIAPPTSAAFLTLHTACSVAPHFGALSSALVAAFRFTPVEKSLALG